jgi:hypothetical protein
MHDPNDFIIIDGTVSVSDLISLLVDGVPARVGERLLCTLNLT